MDESSLMNLYIFNQSRRGTEYGVGTYIREQITALKNRNINIFVINLTADNPQIQKVEINSIIHWYFPKAISYSPVTENKKHRELYYRNIVYLLRLHIEDKKNLVFQLNNCQNKLAEELKKAFVCRVVSVLHLPSWGFMVSDNLPRLRQILNDPHPDSFGETIQELFKSEKSHYLIAYRVICLSNYMKEILCHDYGIDSSKISVIPNGLCDATDDSTINIKYLRKKWNIQVKEQIILFAGRLEEAKGVRYLIKSFHNVLEKCPNCRLIIAGNGNYDTCFQEAKGICTKITFTGLLEKQDLYEWYSIADIGILPSFSEQCSYVAIEMMMHSLPMITSAASGLAEMTEDGVSSLQVPLIELPDRVEIDTDLLTEKILYLLKHPKEAKRLGKNARKRYEEQYSSEIFRKNMLDFYNSLYE